MDAIVLAGGCGTRLGRDKAWEPLMTRVVWRLASTFPRIIVVRPAGPLPPLPPGTPVVPDELPGYGPPGSHLDPELIRFCNLNTPDDLRLAWAVAEATATTASPAARNRRETAGWYDPTPASADNARGGRMPWGTADSPVAIS